MNVETFRQSQADRFGSFPAARAQFVVPGKLLPELCCHCRFWKPKDGILLGVCKRYPPTVPTKEKTEPLPVTENTNSCGEFVRHYTAEEWAAIKLKLKGSEILFPTHS